MVGENMSKQDRQGARTPADLERKYNFGKSFAELMGMATDAQKSLSEMETSLQSSFLEQMTSITRDTESIVMAALESYVETSDLEEFKKTVSSELSVMAERITMSFTSATEQMTTVNGEMIPVVEFIQKHFDFSEDGLLIKAGENSMALNLDNDLIQFMKSATEYGWWNGIDAQLGNIIIGDSQRLQLGNFAVIPRSSGGLSVKKVGG
jgi:hypothetical protein